MPATGERQIPHLWGGADACPAPLPNVREPPPFPFP